MTRTLILTHFGDVDPVAVSFVALPLPNIFLPLLVSPKSVSLHRPVLEISHIVLVPKFEPALPVRPVILEVPKVDSPVGKLHVPLAHFVVKAELALIGGVLC